MRHLLWRGWEGVSLSVCPSVRFFMWSYVCLSVCLSVLCIFQGCGLRCTPSFDNIGTYNICCPHLSYCKKSQNSFLMLVGWCWLRFGDVDWGLLVVDWLLIGCSFDCSVGLMVSCWSRRCLHRSSKSHHPVPHIPSLGSRLYNEAGL